MTAGCLPDDLVDRAVVNNVEWCSTVCPGAEHAGVWTSRDAPAPYYPDAITTRPGVAPGAVSAALEGRASCSVKDSYGDVDLRDHGFDVLFHAEWIGRAGAPGAVPPGWGTVRSAAEQQLWSAAAELPALGHVRPADSWRMLAKRSGDRVLAGAVVTPAGGVAGVSNLFAGPFDPVAVWTDVLALVGDAWPGVPVVGYEHGPELRAAHDAGFEALGPLRVWIRG